MLEILLRFEGLSVAVVAVFVLYIGVAMTAALWSRDPVRAKIGYRIFRDLLSLFRRGRR